jgi:hypothetical protein
MQPNEGQASSGDLKELQALPFTSSNLVVEQALLHPLRDFLSSVIGAKPRECMEGSPHKVPTRV